MRGLFVTGTDTGVGKSVVAASVCAALAARGERVAAFKPVVTGLDDEPGEFGHDHELLASAANAGQAPEDVAPYRFGPPLSPHLAAELAGERIEPAQLLDAARAHELLVCEGVGGLLVPITTGYLVRDLAIDLELPRDRGRPHRARDDQPHAAHRRGGAHRGSACGGRRDDTVAGASRPRSSARTARRSSASRGVPVSGLPHTDRERLAEAGASLPLDDWL